MGWTISGEGQHLASCLAQGSSSSRLPRCSCEVPGSTLGTLIPVYLSTCTLSTRALRSPVDGRNRHKGRYSRNVRPGAHRMQDARLEGFIYSFSPVVSFRWHPVDRTLQENPRLMRGALLSSCIRQVHDLILQSSSTVLLLKRTYPGIYVPYAECTSLQVGAGLWSRYDQNSISRRAAVGGPLKGRPKWSCPAVGYLPLEGRTLALTYLPR